MSSLLIRCLLDSIATLCYNQSLHQWAHSCIIEWIITNRLYPTLNYFGFLCIFLELVLHILTCIVSRSIFWSVTAKLIVHNLWLRITTHIYRPWLRNTVKQNCPKLDHRHRMVSTRMCGAKQAKRNFCFHSHTDRQNTFDLSSKIGLFAVFGIKSCLNLLVSYLAK